ncbi:retrovirus-related pol polyprotein from transposon TNT 1-94 [Tanacetum coccineum]
MGPALLRLSNKRSTTLSPLVPQEAPRTLKSSWENSSPTRLLMASKDETSGILKNFITKIENIVDKKVKIIICDNGTEFKNRVMSEFCEKKGIKREFSIARTPQQNGVAKRRNRTLIEAARTMLADFKLPTTFWAKAVNTACYVLNRVLVVKPHNKTSYELFRGKFDGKSDEGFFIGYSLNSKAFRVYDIRTRKVEENLHIRFLEDKPIIAGIEKDGSLFDSSLKNASNDEPQPSSDAKKRMMKVINTEPGMFSLGDNATLESTHADFFGGETEVDMSNITTAYPVPSTPNTRIHKDHSFDHVIGDVQSSEEPKKVWTLMDLPHVKRAIGTKWVYKNKKDERGIVIRNKARLVVQGYTQEDGIDYDDVFAPVARIEAIRMFLAYASFKEFVVYQMDVKSAFLYGKIEEEVYVCQPLGFEDPEFPDRVYKVEKALYGLHQAPRAWYETLSTYLLDNGFQRGQIDKTLFIKRVKSDILLVQVYVDDIIFGSTKKELCTEFEKLMHKKFQMSSMASTPMETSKPLLKNAEAKDVNVHLYRSMIGSLMYLTSSRPDIMFDVCQPKLGLWYPKDSPFDLEAYSDSDYAGASLDRKSTTGGCQFLGSRLISWQCKKQIVVANSTTEAEYVAAASCYGQNSVFHSKTKHIEIRHHFIRDSNEKKLIQMIKIHTDQNIADLLTKAFDVGRFQYLIASIGMLNL